MILEQRYVLFLLKNRPFNPKLLETLNYNTIIDILLEHKIILHYYFILNQQITDNTTRTRLNQIYISNVVFKKAYFEVLNKLVLSLEQHKIDYRIFKGQVLQEILYQNKQVRMFSDIDLWVINKDIIEIVSLLKQSGFNLITSKVVGQKDIETKIVILYKDIKFTIEIKQKNHHSAFFINNNHSLVNVGGTIVKTFTLEDTLLILMNYFYYYTEDINSLIFDSKSIFQLPFDIHNLIQKYKLELNWNYLLKMAIKDKSIHKVRLGFLKLQQIFGVDYQEYLEIFSIDNINYHDCEIVDIGRIYWNIPVISRFINKNDINQFMIKYRMGDFLIGPGNKNSFNEINELIRIADFTVNYKITRHNDYLKVYLDHPNHPDCNFLIYLNVYGYLTDGFFHRPFQPITILKEADYHVYDRFVITRDDEMSFNREIANQLLLNNKCIKLEKSKTSCVIKIYLSQYELDLTKNIGINVYAYTLSKLDNVIEHYRLVPHYQMPYLLTKVCKDE